MQGLHRIVDPAIPGELDEASDVPAARADLTQANDRLDHGGIMLVDSTADLHALRQRGSRIAQCYPASRVFDLYPSGVSQSACDAAAIGISRLADSAFAVADEGQACDGLLREDALTHFRREAQETDQRCEKVTLVEAPTAIALQPEFIVVDQLRIDVAEPAHRQVIPIEERPEQPQLLDLPPNRPGNGAWSHPAYIFLEEHRHFGRQLGAFPVSQVHQHLAAVIAVDSEPPGIQHCCAHGRRWHSFREASMVPALHAASSGVRSSPH